LELKFDLNARRRLLSTSLLNLNINLVLNLVLNLKLRRAASPVLVSTCGAQRRPSSINGA
jgi:hypothetical protein